MKSSWALVIMTYVGVGLGVGLTVGHFNLPTYKVLLDHGRLARATVSATECDNHATIVARFSVGGRSYAARGTDDFGNPDCRTLAAGDTVVVYYLPSDPNVCEPGDIHERWTNEVISVAGASLILPLVAAFSVWWRVVRPARAGQFRT